MRRDPRAAGLSRSFDRPFALPGVVPCVERFTDCSGRESQLGSQHHFAGTFLVFEHLSTTPPPTSVYTRTTQPSKTNTTSAMAEEPPTKRKCLSADCDQDAGSLQCPTCLKVGIKDSFFCSQECFKKNWVSPPVRRMWSSCAAHAPVGRSLRDKRWLWPADPGADNPRRSRARTS